MIFYISKKIESEFFSNLTDWCLGGPKKEGWTRTGQPITLPKIKINSYKYGTIKVDDGLAKNKEETLKWHISFLQGNPYWYKKEYLELRYDECEVNNRMNEFLYLLKDIKNNGIKKPVWIADISCLELGFDYFRFNGCHRLCCAKFLKISSVPAIIFNTSLA